MFLCLSKVLHNAVELFTNLTKTRVFYYFFAENAISFFFNGSSVILRMGSKIVIQDRK